MMIQFSIFGLLAFALLCFASHPLYAEPLRVHPTNPRYFTDGSGKAVYLTGSHTWGNFKDMDVTDPPPALDFNAHLDTLERYHHNFIRLWTWELSKYTYANESMLYATPFLWERPGPGLALDGKPQFDLTRFDEAYFRRLRERVIAAGKRGFYVSVMLFEGHGVQKSLPPWRWDGHPFHAKNNVNGINGDPNGDGLGIEIHTLGIPSVTAIQEAYVRKVIDAVNDLDNVLYEITNEAGPYSTEWQYHMIRFVKTNESAKRKRHPVGMTFQWEGGKNQTLFDSPADWISPNPEGGYREDPPAGDGRKVILSDTDHLWGIGGNRAWAWKTFLRGHNPIYMDSFNTQGFQTSEEVRVAMGQTLRYAERMNLAAMTPQNALASTGYCLARPSDGVYLVYLPDGGEAQVDLSGTRAMLSVEWFDPRAGEAVSGGTVSGGEARRFVAPFEGDAVLYLTARSDER